MATKIKGVWVRVIEPGLIQVQSFSNPEKWYVVDRFAKTCSCPDHKYRGRVCKHLRLIEEFEWKVELEEKIWKANKEFEEWRKQQAPALTALKLMHTFKEERQAPEELRFERLCLLYLLPEDLKAVGLKAGSLRPGQLKLAGKEDGKNGEE